MSEMNSNSESSLSSTDATAFEDFERAVKSGDTQALSPYLKSTETPNWLTSTRCSKLLLISVLNRDPSMVALLLKLQPHINLDSKSNLLSPLWTAVIYTHEEIIKLLVRAGADLNRRFGSNTIHDRESTVLHFMITAVCSNAECEEIIDLMIEHGADVNAQDSKGQTPLHYAVGLNDRRLASKLISKGAGVNISDKLGESPLLSAAKNVVKEEMIILLIRHGADVFARTHDGFNALHFLANASTECPAAAEILLKRAVPLCEYDNIRMYTPLHYAVMKGKEMMTKIFLEYGADANACRGASAFPLLLAATCKSPLIVELLIAKGADLEKTTKKGKTALHNACQNVKEKNVAVLLEYGANINALDKKNATPFSLIEFKNLSMSVKAMIKMFAKHTALNKPTNEIDLAIIKEYPKLQAFYEDCLKEIDEMRKIKLFNDVSYFSMFSKSLVKLALLLRDRRFLLPLKIKKVNRLFPIYCTDFNHALFKAKLLYIDLYYMENRLNAIFGDYTADPIIREIMMGLLPSYLHV